MERDSLKGFFIILSPKQFDTLNSRSSASCLQLMLASLRLLVSLSLNNNAEKNSQKFPSVSRLLVAKDVARFEKYHSMTSFEVFVSVSDASHGDTLCIGGKNNASRIASTVFEISWGHLYCLSNRIRSFFFGNRSSCSLLKPFHSIELR